MNAIRNEADSAIARAEEAEAKVKKLEQDNLNKEQEISSYKHRLGILEQENEKMEVELKTHKENSLNSVSSKTTADGLQRKVQLLEEELDAAEKNLKETMEKYARVVLGCYRIGMANSFTSPMTG